MTDDSDPSGEITKLEALQLIADTKQEHDECPVCGGEYEGVDMTHGGDLVFFHDDNSCSYNADGVDSVVL